jgi:hypothetical protein
MDSLKQYLALKKQVRKHNRKIAQLEGAQAELLKRLKKEFGCSSYKEGKELLKRLEKEQRKRQREFAAELKKFKRRHRKELS